MLRRVYAMNWMRLSRARWVYVPARAWANNNGACP